MEYRRTAGKDKSFAFLMAYLMNMRSCSPAILIACLSLCLGCTSTWMHGDGHCEPAHHARRLAGNALRRAQSIEATSVEHRGTPICLLQEPRIAAYVAFMCTPSHKNLPKTIRGCQRRCMFPVAPRKRCVLTTLRAASEIEPNRRGILGIEREVIESARGSKMAAFLESRNIRADFKALPAPGGTAINTAEALQIPPDRVVKSLVFLADGAPVLVVLCGNTRVDTAKLGAAVLKGDGAGRKKRVELAPVPDAERITGYTVGSIPPFNLAYAVTATIIDEGVLKHMSVFCGCGTPGVEMELSVHDLLQLTGAYVHDVAINGNSVFIDKDATLRLDAGRTEFDQYPFVDQVPTPLAGVLRYAEKGDIDKWVDGQDLLVIWRSKIGKRLLFCGVTPAPDYQTGGLPQGGTAGGERQVWRWGDGCVPLCKGSPFQLQLIVGKTLTLSQGDVVDETIRRLRVGQRVRVWGRVQGQEQMTSVPRDDVIDLIVHHVTFYEDQATASDRVGSLEAQSQQRIRGEAEAGSRVPGEERPVRLLQQVTEADVLLVDTPAKIDQMLTFLGDAASENVRVLGVDAEWRPRALEGSESSSVCLMQISDGKRAVLVDFVALLADDTAVQEKEKEDIHRRLDAALDQLVNDDQALLLGFSFDTDAHKLVASFPRMQSLHKLWDSVVEYRSNFIDLQDLVKAYLRVPRNLPMGLSAACNRVLGAQLDKGMQVSDWQARPLSVEQIRYAATDAQCLVILYNAIGNNYISAARAYAEARANENRRKRQGDLAPTQEGSDWQSQGQGVDTGAPAAYIQDACVGNLYAQALLGNALPKRGKGAVFKVLGQGGVKGPGTAEWRNAVALFVNVGAKRFNNTFFNEGREISWFASRKQCNEGLLRDVIARAARAGKVVLRQRANNAFDHTRSDASQAASPSDDASMSGSLHDTPHVYADEDASKVLLFCRTASNPYVFLGELQLLRADLSVVPALLVWHLAEYDSLASSLYFKNILEAAQPA